MDTSQTNNKDTPNNKNTKTESDRDKIKQILIEFGLDPSDYIFNSSQKQTSTSQPHSSFTSKRPLSYVQQRPLPPPPVINRQASKTRLSNNMNQQEVSSRRAPPSPPPSHFKSDTNYPNLSAEHYLHQIDTLDNPPVKVLKPNTEDLVYKKDIRIRYLQPPTPPPPAPIIIREKRLPPNRPESPLLIRERKPEPITPPPLTIRERPPTPPLPLEPYIIDKPIPPPPRQPRQIIVERLPTPPPKPRTVIFEKWLPYKQVKRPILLQKAPPEQPVKPTRNIIVEYEPSKVYTVRRVIEEGIFRVDPIQYTYYNNAHEDANIRMVDRIDDLPMPSEELLRALKYYDQEKIYASNAALSTPSEPLTNVSHLSNKPTQHQEQNVLQAHKSPILSPTITPHQNSQSKTSSRASSN